MWSEFWRHFSSSSSFPCWYWEVQCHFDSWTFLYVLLCFWELPFSFNSLNFTKRNHLVTSPLTLHYCVGYFLDPSVWNSFPSVLGIFPYIKALISKLWFTSFLTPETFIKPQFSMILCLLRYLALCRILWHLLKRKMVPTSHMPSGFMSNPRSMESGMWDTNMS